jgi:lysophospholipase L1-like esterase
MHFGEVLWDPSKSFRNSRIAEFNAAAKETADTVGARFLDVFGDPLLELQCSHLTWDGLHFSATGHERIAHLVSAELQEIGWRA